jgi:hypothetical protein
VDIANAFKSAFVLGSELAAYNSVNDPTWGNLAATVPAAVQNGLIVGTQLAPADVSNAIGSVNNIVAYMGGVGSPAYSNWMNSIQKLASPIV